MLESAKQKKRYGKVYVRKPHSMGGHHSDSTKIKVISTYLACGNWNLTADLCKVPLPTLNNWKVEPWFKELMDEIIISKKSETNKRLSKQVDLALNVVEDRLQNGDFQWDPKTSQMVRVPVKVRDAHRIAVDMIDRQEILEANIAKIQNKEAASQSNALKDLAAAFEKFSNTIKTEQKTIDVTDVVEIVESDRTSEAEAHSGD